MLKTMGKTPPTPHAPRHRSPSLPLLSATLVRALVLVAALVAPAVLGAQGTPPSGAPSPLTPGGSGRVPVTVVLVDRLPVPDAPFVVERRPDLSPADRILLRPDADPVALSAAVRTLLTARQAGGDLPAARALVRMRPQPRQPGAASTPSAAVPAGQAAPGQGVVFPWSAGVLAALRQAAPRLLPGVGQVRAVDLWLPRQRPTSTRRSR